MRLVPGQTTKGATVMTVASPRPVGKVEPVRAMNRIGRALLRMLGAGCISATLFGWLYGLLAFTGFQTIFPGAVVGGSGGEIFLIGAMIITPLVSMAVLIRSISLRRHRFPNAAH